MLVEHVVDDEANLESRRHFHAECRVDEPPRSTPRIFCEADVARVEARDLPGRITCEGAAGRIVRIIRRVITGIEICNTTPNVLENATSLCKSGLPEVVPMTVAFTTFDTKHSTQRWRC